MSETKIPPEPSVILESLSTETNTQPTQIETEPPSEYIFNHDYRFWCIMIALCTMQILRSLENTVVVTSLPTIVKHLDLGSSYIWVTNIFFLTGAVTQPLTGQLADLFGRRHIALLFVALYTLGSGICGGANTSAMLIAGRAIQGAGSGGMTAIMGIVISDLVPLRWRSAYQATLAGTYAFGMAIGPVVGGVIVQRTGFYINPPICGVSFVLLWWFLRVKWDRELDVWVRLRRIDVIGNGLLVVSTVSILIALTWAGSLYAWSSFRFIVPLILGLVGLVGFFWVESSGWIVEPVMPRRLFANRTAIIIYINTFIISILNYWIFFFLPLYFQAVRLSSPTRSGVQILPITLIAIPGAAIGALALSRWGKYKHFHITGFALLAAGIDSLSTLTKSSSTAQWICLQILPSVGAGMVLDTLLPAVQAGVAEVDSAAVTASWSFVRSFGNIWGVPIPGAVLNIYSTRYAYEVITDPTAKLALQNGNSYSSATREFIESSTEPTRSQIIGVFAKALSRVFLIGMVFPILAFILSFCEREVKLRKVLETEFGLEERTEGKRDGR
ncbi:uncharacterized protein EAE97_003687 [Botrytis byssoidea]|uniref:Major facilitator superfamily (MFS) profile domain-containing protein n=1 Tax=Botrytis byssoidea TaxID=139641 RepID=A0A9P5ISZ3_9HELO|nr:uncharacterized protein EAE97_003687 [Botrytis byssoidea]KAF7948276.1 hypothetical protein EAE97_003687 [Botrytis byssoidea]